jgi:hypothetical protein
MLWTTLLGQANMGIIDLDKASENLPLQDSLLKEFEKKIAEFYELQDELNVLSSVPQGQNSVPFNDSLLAEMKAQNEADRLANFHKYIEKKQEELMVFQEKCATEIRNFLMKKVEEFSALRYIDVIYLDKDAVYCRRCVDYTTPFIEFLSH